MKKRKLKPNLFVCRVGSSHSRTRVLRVSPFLFPVTFRMIMFSINGMLSRLTRHRASRDRRLEGCRSRDAAVRCRWWWVTAHLGPRLPGRDSEEDPGHHCRPERCAASLPPLLAVLLRSVWVVGHAGRRALTSPLADSARVVQLFRYERRLFSLFTRNTF